MPVEAFKAAKVLDSYKGDLTGLPVGEIKDKSKKQKTTEHLSYHHLLDDQVCKRKAAYAQKKEIEDKFVSDAIDNQIK